MTCLCSRLARVWRSCPLSRVSTLSRPPYTHLRLHSHSAIRYALVHVEALAKERDEARHLAEDLQQRIDSESARATSALEDEAAARREASETAAVLARSQKSLQVCVVGGGGRGAMVRDGDGVGGQWVGRATIENRSGGFTSGNVDEQQTTGRDSPDLAFPALNVL